MKIHKAMETVLFLVRLLVFGFRTCLKLSPDSGKTCLTPLMNRLQSNICKQCKLSSNTGLTITAAASLGESSELGKGAAGRKLRGTAKAEQRRRGLRRRGLWGTAKAEQLRRRLRGTTKAEQRRRGIAAASRDHSGGGE